MKYLRIDGDGLKQFDSEDLDTGLSQEDFLDIDSASLDIVRWNETSRQFERLTITREEIEYEGEDEESEPVTEEQYSSAGWSTI